MACLGWLQNLALGGDTVTVSVTVPQTQIPRVAVTSSQIPRDPYVAFDINAHIESQIDDRLTGVDLDLFASAYSNGGANPWSTTCWAQFDFSGRSPYNDSGDPTKTVTMISLRHCIGAEHHELSIGDIVSFVKSDGTEYNATIEGKIEVDATFPSSNDLVVYYLDADVPVTYYKILSSDFTDYINIVGLPVVLCDSEHKALVGILVGRAVDTGDFLLIEYNEGSSPRDAYWEDPASNDSGDPSFLPVGGELILLGIGAGKDAGTGTRRFDSGMWRWRTAINTAMADLDTADTGYQLTQFDFEAFLALTRRESVAAGTIGRVAVGSGTIGRI